MEAEQLVLAYGDCHALNGLTLAVPGGQVFGSLGPNGSGKSTLVLALAGLLQLKAGSLRVLGRVPPPAVRAHMASSSRAAAWTP